MSMKSTVYIQKEEDWYVATSIETGVASQGKTIDDALTNLSEALSLYFEDASSYFDDSSQNAASSPILITTLEVSV